MAEVNNAMSLKDIPVVVESGRNEGADSRPEEGRCRLWCRKYFWEGQTLLEKNVRTCEEAASVRDVSSWVARHRRLVAVTLPAIFFYIMWLTLTIHHNTWHLFKERYVLSITMVFGSMIAGMTSEGGGAVAFPVLTLALKVAPAVARDVALMLQSCGMTAAAFSIWYMRIQVDRVALVFCSIGGVFGVTLGLSLLAPALTGAQSKIIFVSVWFSFAFALFLLNRKLDRPTFRTLPGLRAWVCCVLLLTGAVGGLFTSIAGSGLDITCFSVLTLLFRVTEKTATPTSVVLMAINTCVGFFWRQLVMEEVIIEAWEYLAVCVPVIVIGAPFGALLGTHFHRLVQASFIYILVTIALVSALIIIPMTLQLWLISGGLVVFCFVLFFCLTQLGYRIAENQLR